VTKSGASQADFDLQLRSVLSKRPYKLLPRVVGNLMPHHPDADGQWREGTLASQRTQLVDLVHLAAFPSKIITLLNRRALHSARKLAQEVRVPQNLKVRPILWQVLVACLAHNQSPFTHIPSVARGEHEQAWLSSPEGTEFIAQLLSEARQCDFLFAKEWIARLEGAENLRQAIDWLRKDWKRLDPYLSTPQRKASYMALSAIESSLLARVLEAAAQDIDPGGESRDAVLAKIGLVLADLQLTETGATPLSDVGALLDVLTGEQSASY
jgi:hypothetical protein